MVLHASLQQWQGAMYALAERSQGHQFWSAGRALVPRSWYLFCLCCLASKGLCKSSATFGDRRIVAVDSLSFNTRLISNCTGEYSRPDIGVSLYAKRAKCISRPSSDAFFVSCLIVPADLSLFPLDGAW